MRGRLSFSPVRFSIVGLLVLSAASLGLLAEDEWAPGMQELYRLDHLAVLKESTKVASVSSYDRTGGNNDGFGGQYSYVRKEKDGLVLADLEGPGVIYRIWTPTPTDDVLEFYFDGQDKPEIRVKFGELFMGKHPAFERPLVGFGAGGFYSYVPLPYEKSCKVFIRAQRMQFYQINYATYQQGMGIKSFRAKPIAEQRRHVEKAKGLLGSPGKDVSAYVVPDGGKIEPITAKAHSNGSRVRTTCCSRSWARMKYPKGRGWI